MYHCSSIVSLSTLRTLFYRILPSVASVPIDSTFNILGVWSTVRISRLLVFPFSCYFSNTLFQVAWPLIGNYSCPINSPCPRSSNQGWRYFIYTMGAFMFLLWAIRFFIFKLYESPKYHMGRGRDDLAVEVVHKIAKYNGTTSSLTLEHLESVGKYVQEDEVTIMDTSAMGALRRKLSHLNGTHVKSLFATRKLAWSTSLLIVLWGTVII
jgi:hypothetical protein